MKTFSDDEVTLDAFPDSDVIIDKPEDKKFSTGARIGVETAGALTGELVGAQLGSAIPGVGTAVGAYAGGAVGAGMATYNMDKAEGKPTMEALGSAAYSAGGQLVAPAIIRKVALPATKWVIHEIPRSLGWVSGLGRSAVERIQKDPDIIMKNIGVTKYDIDDSAKALAETIKEGLKGQELTPALKEVSDGINFVLKDSNPSDALAHFLKKPLPKEITGTVEGMTDDFMGKQIALESKQLLGKFGVENAPIPLVGVVGYGLLNMSMIGTGVAGLAAKSPITAAAAAVAEGATSKVARKVLDKTPEVAKGAIVKTIASTAEQELKE